jgi:hypothetical protein
VNGTLVKPSTSPATLGGQVVHTLATRVGSKVEWDAKDALALTIITNCLELINIIHYYNLFLINRFISMFF